MRPRKEIEEDLLRNSSMIANYPDTVQICDAIRISARILLDIREILTNDSEYIKRLNLAKVKITSPEELEKEMEEEMKELEERKRRSRRNRH